MGPRDMVHVVYQCMLDAEPKIAQVARKTFAAFKAAGADAQYTEFPEAGHNSWDATYRHDAMWEWLFAQRKD